MITDFEILDYLKDTFQTDTYKDVAPILSKISSQDKARDMLVNLKKRDWVNYNDKMEVTITHGGYMVYLNMVRERQIIIDNADNNSKTMVISVSACICSLLALLITVWLPQLTTQTKWIISGGAVVILSVILQSQLRKGKKS